MVMFLEGRKGSQLQASWAGAIDHMHQLCGPAVASCSKFCQKQHRKRKQSKAGGGIDNV